MEIIAYVFPSASKERVKVRPDGAYEIHVKQEAQRNEANERVREILAREHAVPLSALRLTKGHRAGKKTFSLLW